MRAAAMAIGATLLVAALAAGNGASGTVPCQGTLGPLQTCPDLVVDRDKLASASLATRTFGSTDCAVVEGMVSAGSRTLLRFTFTTPNVGTGDLVVGAPAAHPEWFVYAPCHAHYHFREYADYRLWTPTGYAQWLAVRAQQPDRVPAEILAENPGLADHFVAGNKAGFCMIDVVRYIQFADNRQFGNCKHGQGITAGWADEYHASLDGQWIDVTGLPPGEYVLEGEVNAERLFDESSYANNAAAVRVMV